MSTTSQPETLRVIIVDDEEPARRLLGEYLASFVGFEVVADCGNGFDAVKAVMDHDPDLLLLDIMMPKLDGFEVLELIEREVPVIFVTAYDEHALRAFEVHAVDYLLKPFSAERLGQALRRARARIEPRVPIATLAAAARPDQGFLERILVREGPEVHVIPVASISHIEAKGDAIMIHSQGGSHQKLQRLAALEERLDPARFMRVHRSFVVNLEHLSRLELYAKNSYLAILSSGTRIPISRTGYTRLRELG